MDIATDIDGVLTNETEGHDYANRTPNQENIDKINALYDEGHTITLYTARYSVDAEVTTEWLQENKVKYHNVVFDKLQYDQLIDDKAFPISEFTPESIIRRQLEFIGEDPKRDGIQETPKRVLKSWQELYSGYSRKPEDVLTVFEADGYDQIVLLRDIEMYSMCEHHMLPFFGKAHVAYLPNEKVIGISKLARLVEIYARRLQIQERIGQQVTNALMKLLQAKGAACIIEAEHLCMRMRGVGKQNSVMTTSSMEGAFRESSNVKNELMQLLK